MELQPVFQLQRLPQMLQTLLSEQDCGEICVPQAPAPEVMAVQEPAGDQQVAAFQPKKKTFKKKPPPAEVAVPTAALRPAAAEVSSYTVSRPELDTTFASNISIMELQPGVAPSPAAVRETRAPRAS
jgi:hypothetical protein